MIKDAYGRWAWPKGHIDQGEKSQDAALREISEEVGLKGLSILGKAGQSNYFFRLKDDLIFKTVVFFLVEADEDEKLKVQKDEIAEARWFKPEAALKTVEYKGAKEMLARAIKMYRGMKRCSG